MSSPETRSGSDVRNGLEDEEDDEKNDGARAVVVDEGRLTRGFFPDATDRFLVVVFSFFFFFFLPDETAVTFRFVMDSRDRSLRFLCFESEKIANHTFAHIHTHSITNTLGRSPARRYNSRAFKMVKKMKFNVNEGTTVGSGGGVPASQLPRKSPKNGFFLPSSAPNDETSSVSSGSSSGSSGSSSSSSVSTASIHNDKPIPHSRAGGKQHSQAARKRAAATKKAPRKKSGAGGNNNNNLTAEQAVKKHQRTGTLLIRKLPFQRFLRHIAEQLKKHVRFSEIAIEALQYAVEAETVRRLIIANAYRAHVGRKGIKEADLELVDMIEGPWFDQQAVFIEGLSPKQKRAYYAVLNYVNKPGEDNTEARNLLEKAFQKLLTNKRLRRSYCTLRGIPYDEDEGVEEAKPVAVA